MARLILPARTGARDRLDPPELVPTNADIVEPSGFIDRSCQMPMAPDTESRLMFADRMHVRFTPGAAYANVDVQKGGAPGSGGVITQCTVDGKTVVDGVPHSPIKLSTGMQDVAFVNPQPAPVHGKIPLRQNPNDAKTTIGLWTNERPYANTNYESPAPWAAGLYIG